MSFRFRVSGFRLRNLIFIFKRRGKLFSVFSFQLSLFLLAACGSIPNLEKPECSAARQTVKEFYSYHFGNEMMPSKENLRAREKFLSDNLKNQLAAQTETTVDYFTATADYPKAFRIGECKVGGENKTVFQIVLFWKDDTRNQQKEVNAELVKQNDKWLVNRIF